MGDFEIKDVCSSCNNGVLSELDAYGKSLFLQFFREPAYRGETFEFRYDHSLLVRWLLKLCFNSARVHNADTYILKKYARYISRLEPMPGDVVVYVHLICPTDVSTLPLMAAQRIIGNPDYIERPEWFRLTQFRPDVQYLTELVQRQVYIDSYCFTLFVPDPSRPEHADASTHIQPKFLEYMPSAVPLPESGVVTLRAGYIHLDDVGVEMVANYPARFAGLVPSGSEEISHTLKKLIDGDAGGLVIQISREEIEEGNISPTVRLVHELVLTRESTLAVMQGVALLIHGWDDEPIALWNVPQVREWIIRLFEECPHLIFLISPGSTSLEMIAACYCRSDDSTDGQLYFDPARVKKFCDTGFEGLNGVTQRHAISVEHNRRICEHVAAVLDSFLPPAERGFLDAMREIE
jgi:hypothetical protein